MDPANYVIVGPSQAGKSTILTRIISEKERLFRHKEKFSAPNVPNIVIYSYGIYSGEVDKLFRGGLVDKAIKGLPETFEQLEKTIRPYSKVGVILIVDDAISHFMSAKKSSYLPQMFETLSHHLNCSVFFSSQSMFLDSTLFRRITSNVHYRIIVYNSQGENKVRDLARQIEPNHVSWFMNVYLDACRKEKRLSDGSGKKYRGYLLVSGHPNIDQYQRYTTNIFKKENYPYTMYVREGVELK
jgi:hypothetical protein